MITREGYSKGPSIIPEGIAVTFGKEMIAEKGGLLRFIRWFESCVGNEDGYWLHKCKNKPRYDDLLYVYVIICNRVYYRCYYSGYGTQAKGYMTPDGPLIDVPWEHIILAGPFESGFQGFRYATKLF